ncbi:hypothetical protein QYE76_007204 [Lolium multiflorum]|uniref:Uncharacterized protein n=1 Tax=Lolium multiflorum TaxID=4521 RepID=A0AAD8RXD0_LOLMU|nr:hypothetical protein QYE76_007204 [Lolium multiflorum]
MKKAAELLKKKDEEIDINYVRKLVASAMQQQSKADTSRRLESNPDHCISTAQKDAPASQHRDGESRTGSTERRRRRQVSCPITTTPDFASSAPRRRSLAETPAPWAVESTSATTCRRLGTGAHAGATQAGTKTASPSLVGTKTASRLAEAKDLKEPGTKSARLRPQSRNDGDDHHQEEGSHRSRSQPRSSAGSPKAEEHPTGPLADLPRHHPVEAEVEAEAEAGDPVPAQSHPAAVPVTLGNASTSTDPTTSVQSVLAG